MQTIDFLRRLWWPLNGKWYDISFYRRIPNTAMKVCCILCMLWEFFSPLPTNCRIFIENAKHFYDNVNVLRNQLSRRRVNNRHVQIVHNQFELHIQFQDACRASHCHLQMIWCIFHCLQILLLLYELLRIILYKCSLYKWRCSWFKTTNRFYLVK